MQSLLPKDTLLRTYFSTPSKDMFDLLKWMPIHKRLLYNKATLTYKVLNGLSPEYITNMLTPTSQVHDQTLRSLIDGTLMVPRSRTSLYDKSFSVSAPKYLNSLPSYIKNAPSLSSFQTLLYILLYKYKMLLVENALNLSFSQKCSQFYAPISNLHQILLESG